MPGHDVGCVLLPHGEGPHHAHVPQGLVEGQQLGGEVQGGQAAAGAAQPPRVLASHWRHGAPEQGVGLHRRVQERVGFLFVKTHV